MWLALGARETIRMIIFFHLKHYQTFYVELIDHISSNNSQMHITGNHFS